MRRFRPLRITHLLATANVGGVQGSVADLSARLDPSRFAVEAVFLADGPAVDRMRALGLPVTVLDEPDDAAAVHALAQHLTRNRTDVFHAHQFRAELLGARAARLARSPAVVATAHSSRVRSPQDIRALAAETPFLDRLIVPSEAMAAKVRAEGRGGAAITVIPNGVDIHRFGVRLTPDQRAATRASLGIPADAFLVGVVARLEPEKGHRHLLAAWPTILAVVPHAWLVVAGDGSLAQRLRTRVAAMPLQARDRVRFTGSLADIGLLTASLDVAVLPSLREAQGIAVLEAMAAGLPVIASAVGGIPETIRHEVDGLLVPAADAPTLAAAVVRLASDDALRSRLAAAGRRRVEDRFDLTATVHSLTAVYEELAAEGVDRTAGLRYS